MTANRLKVCFFNTCPVGGGGEKWHHDMATTLDPERFEVFAGVQPGSVLQQRLAAAGVPLRTFRLGNLSLFNPWRLRQLVGWFRKERFDVVLLNLPSDLKAAGVAARLAGVPRIIYRRGSAIPVRDTILNRWLFSRVLTEVIANSEKTKQTVLSRNPSLIDPAKIRVIYNGIDVERYTRGNADHAVEQGGPIIIGTVGRLSRQKNQQFLLEVAMELQQRGVDFRMKIGGAGPLQEDLLARCRALGLEDRVSFPGFVEDVPGFMAGLDIFVLCSLWEGFGYVLAEAMAAGLPVVSFGSSSVPEVVADGETGLLTPPGDVAVYCDALERLAGDPGMRSRMAAAGRVRVEQKFSRRRLLAELEGFLRQAPSRASAGEID